MRSPLLLCCLSCSLWLALVANRVAAEPAKPAAAAAPAAVAPRRDASIRLGKSSSEVRVSLEEASETLVLRVGSARAALPLGAARSLDAQTVKLGGDVQVGIVRVHHERGESAALVVRDTRGAPAIAWVDRVDLHGDPGERLAGNLEVADRDGDGTLELVVGTYDERVRLCGESKTLLHAQILDVQTATLRPWIKRESSAPLETIVATEQPPAGLGATPLVSALRATSASGAQAGHAAHALTDGDAATYWAAPAADRGSFVTLRWEAPTRAIAALAITLAPASARSGAAAPRALTLLGERGQRIHVTLPATIKDATRYWLVPKAPLLGTCWSLAFEASAPQPALAALAEAQAFTDVDAPGGLAKLVAEAVADGPGAADAVEMLARAGSEVVAPVIAGWSAMPTQSKRRVVRALATRASEPQALALLDLGLRDASGEVNATALEAALSSWPRSADLLARVAAEPSATGDDAARSLAEKAASGALPVLLRALGSPGGSERPALRDAIRSACRGSGTTANEAVQTWLATSPTIAARAAAALALSGADPVRELAASLVSAAIADVSEFSDEWRLVEAAAALKPDAATDAWLAHQAGSAEAWMLRAAALQALTARGAEQAPALAHKALLDPYPRVRSGALRALATAPDKLEIYSSSVHKDKWFLVRIAALDELRDEPGSAELLTSAVDDRTAVVRAAAIRGLRRQRTTAAWPKIGPHVLKSDEYPEVIAEGIGFAKALCIQDAGAALQEVVTRGLKPDAWPPDVDLALSALEALVALGGEHAAWALQRSAVPLVPEAMRKAMERDAKAGAGCMPTE